MLQLLLLGAQAKEFKFTPDFPNLYTREARTHQARSSSNIVLQLNVNVMLLMHDHAHRIFVDDPGKYIET
jgi:hypothetical protein